MDNYDPLIDSLYLYKKHIRPMKSHTYLDIGWLLSQCFRNFDLIDLLQLIVTALKKKV